MKRIKTRLLTMALLLCSISASAGISGSVNSYMWETEDFEVDGIYYCINDNTNKTVSIVNPLIDYGYTPPSPYGGDFIIPKTVTYNNEVYIVNRIADYAFYCSKNIKSIVIPESIQEIGYESLYFCDNLKDIYFLGNCPNCVNTKQEVFNTRYVWSNGCNIYIPQKSVYAETWISQSYLNYLIEYVTFEESEFNYCGQVPTINYINNLSNKYEITMKID